MTLLLPLLSVYILILLIISIIVSTYIDNIYSLIIFLCIFSLFSVMFFIIKGAFDVAMTEVAIGSFLSFFVLMCILYPINKKYITYKPFSIKFLLFFGIVIYVFFTLHSFTHIQSILIMDRGNQLYEGDFFGSKFLYELQDHIKTYVTPILVLGRGLDTLGETAIIFLSSIGFINIINSYMDEK